MPVLWGLAGGPGRWGQGLVSLLSGVMQSVGKPALKVVTADASRELFNLEGKKERLLVLILKQGLLDRTYPVCLCIRVVQSAKRIE